MALERPRRKELGQEPHPALARARALPRKINCKFGDSGDGEPGGGWGGGIGQKNGDAEVFGEGFIARAADWTTASEWRQAIPRPHLHLGSHVPFVPASWALAPLAAPFLGRPDAEVWGLGSGFRLRTVHLPHTHTRLRHGHSGCRTSNSSPDIFNHGETSLCLVARNRPGLYSRTSLTRALALLSSPRRGPSS